MALGLSTGTEREVLGLPPAPMGAAGGVKAPTGARPAHGSDVAGGFGVSPHFSHHEAAEGEPGVMCGQSLTGACYDWQDAGRDVGREQAECRQGAGKVQAGCRQGAGRDVGREQAEHRQGCGQGCR